MSRKPPDSKPVDANGRHAPAADSTSDRTQYRYLRILGGFLIPYKWHIAGTVLALVVSSATVLTFGVGLRWLVDHGFESGVDGLDKALLGMLAIVAVLAISTFVRAYMVAWIGERVAADLRRDVFANVVRLDPAFFEVTPTGEVLSRLTADTTLLQTVVGSSASWALRNLLMMIGGLIMMAVTNPKLTGLVILVVPLVVGPILFFGRRVRRLSRASQDRIGDVGAHIDETLNAVRTIQAFNHEQVDTDSFTDQVELAFSTSVRRVLARSFLTGLVILTAFTAVGVILWIGGRDLLAGRITPGDLSAFIFFSVVVAGAVGALSEFIADIQRAAGASERLVELLKAEPAIRPPQDPITLPTPAKGIVRFDSVSFKYPARPDQAALDAFDLDIAAGEKIALVGPSGAGKSTVFQLLLRFYDPQNGSIAVDGVDLRRTDPAAVRARIGMVPQEPIMFSDDVTANIRFGRPDASDDEVRAAAAAAQADFVDDLPEGFATYLGEKGIRLSVGQRQRLAIARAILRDPAILLLDEATSALDARSEKAVQAALNRVMAERTTLIIAHRLATVLKADRIVVMEAGRVVATGTHEELIGQGGLYAHLAELQFDLAGAAL